MGSSMPVVIVEEDLKKRDELSSILKYLNYHKIYEVASYRDGLAMVAASKSLEVIFVNPHIKGAMTGKEFISKIRSNSLYHSVPIVLLTYITRQNIALEIGADIGIQEPYDSQGILKKVQEAFLHRSRVISKTA